MAADKIGQNKIEYRADDVEVIADAYFFVHTIILGRGAVLFKVGRGSMLRIPKRGRAA